MMCSYAKRLSNKCGSLTLWMAEVRRPLHGHADGASRANAYGRAFEHYVRASGYGLSRLQIRHARDCDGPHRGDGDVDVI